METKVCRDCGTKRSIHKFSPRRNGDGRYERCNGCPTPLARTKKGSDQRVRNRGSYTQEYRIRQHGITLEQYQEMADRQGNLCAICGGPELGRAFSIDHDHSCCPGKHSCGGCIRGLLCNRCNSGLGYFRDNPDYLREAANYLASIDR